MATLIGAEGAKSSKMLTHFLRAMRLSLQSTANLKEPNKKAADDSAAF